MVEFVGGWWWRVWGVGGWARSVPPSSPRQGWSVWVGGGEGGEIGGGGCSGGSDSGEVDGGFDPAAFASALLING